MTAPQRSYASLNIADLTIPSAVLLAPLSGITDLPFRRAARRYTTGLVVTEMVASKEMCAAKRDSLMRAQGSGETEPLSVQLAGREAYWMGEAARLVEAGGARLIDINMGCPARKVTGGQSGSALMRDLDHALGLIEATVKAVSVPVTLKMRTGWDDTSRNAPDLAARAEAAGVAMVTVHGRTRCQFYDGTADWDFIRTVKKSVRVPVIANGDIVSPAAALDCLARSGADGVMVGRGAQGRPWLLREVDAALRGQKRPPMPDLDERQALIHAHYEDMLSLYGPGTGVRVARKHLVWYLEAIEADLGLETGPARAVLCRENDPAVVLTILDHVFGDLRARAKEARAA